MERNSVLATFYSIIVDCFAVIDTKGIASLYLWWIVICVLCTPRTCFAP